LIGVLSPTSAAMDVRNIAALRQGLRDLGYAEGQNIAIEYRFAGGVSDRLDRFAAELVGLKAAIVVVGSTLGIVSASKVTQAVPLIAIGGSEDPVRLGLAKSFARPGGNITGFLLTADHAIVGKRLQLLRDAAPGISRVGIVANPDAEGAAQTIRPLLSPSSSGERRMILHAAMTGRLRPRGAVALRRRGGRAAPGRGPGGCG